MIAGFSLMGSWAGSGHAESWDGPHLGVFVGQAENDNVFVDVDGFAGPGPGFIGEDGVAGARASYDDDAAAYGVLAGYDWQSGDFVFGIEMDFTLADAKSSVDADPQELDETISSDFDYIATLRARAGWTTGPVLLFGTVGIALGSYENAMVDIDQDAAGEYTVFDTDDSFADQNTGIALVLGGGVEFKVREHWSIRAEGHYMDFGTDTNFVNFADDAIGTNGPQQYDIENELVILRFAVTYAF